jgi:SAM-dependent methyltransferase
MSGPGIASRIVSAVLARPFVYELVQAAAGQRRVAERLREAAAPLPKSAVLDVGSASGGFALRLGMRPVCLDLDPRAVRALRRTAGYPALAGDATRLPFPDRRFELSLCVAVSHHLDDAALSAAIRELARVTSGRLLFLDALRNDSRALSRWLWSQDRGRHPRTYDDLRERIASAFAVREERRFTVYHQYALWVASPR